MFDHVVVPVTDADASRRFYESALGPLGAKVMHESAGFVALGGDSGFLALRQRDEVLPLHVAFRTDRAGVDAFYEAAIAAGGVDNGAPGLRPNYHANYYAAFVHDPDGHNIEAVSHSAA
jgi:catechol 2,3-dioxygenase-like lactoylglutathione lyase family enzyme